MRRCASFLVSAAVLSVSLVLSMSLVATSTFAQEVGTAKTGAAQVKAGEPQPEFKSEKYEKLYAKAREEFDKGEYKDAAKSFKSAARGAKSKDDKALVTNWANACKGAPILKQAEALQKRNYWNEAYDKLLVSLPKYRGTPIEDAFLKSVQDLERVLFQNIEMFDRPSRLYSKKYGKTFIQDKKLLANGTMCLHWQNTKDGKPGVLKISAVPVDWSQFSALEMWVNTRVPAKGEIVLMSVASRKSKPGQQKTRAGQSIVPMLMQPIILPRRGGWQYIRLKIPEFKPQGDADLARVTDLRIQFPGGKSFDFFVDDIRLRRKNPAQSKGKAKPPTRR